MRVKSPVVVFGIALIALVFWASVSGDQRSGATLAETTRMRQALVSPLAEDDLAPSTGLAGSVREQAASAKPQLGEQGAASDAMNLESSSVPGRSFTGRVITVRGDPVSRCHLHVRPRPLWPGEDDGEVPRFDIQSDASGGFAATIPLRWDVSVVHCSVIVNDAWLTAGSYSVGEDVLVVVPEPRQPDHFALDIEFDCAVEKAALLLTTPTRLGFWGEAIWEPQQSKPLVQLMVPVDRISGPVSVLVGELGEGLLIQQFQRFNFDSIEACRDSGKTLRVPCYDYRIAVPGHEGRSVQKVRLWSMASSPAAGVWLAVDRGEVVARIGSGLAFGAEGQTAEGEVLLGEVELGQSTGSIRWLARVEPQLGFEVRVVDRSGNAVVDLYSTSELEVGALENGAQRFGNFNRGLHRVIARPDQDGWIRVKKLCRGRYRLTIESRILGEFRRQIFYVDVPSPPSVCVFDPGAVARIMLAMPPIAIETSLMRAWMRKTGGSWREVTDARWQVGLTGIVGPLAPATYDFTVSLPPFAGSTSCVVPPGGNLIDVLVPMSAETTVRGVVRDAEGRPVEGRLVTSLPGDRPTGPEWSTARTDAEGRFELVLVPGMESMIVVWNAAGLRPSVQCLPSPELELRLPVGD